ncbi:hypothetical protein B14911_17850, partial [Bacillus sp. NRRL B-14911]
EGKQLSVWMRRDQRKINQGQCQRFVNTEVSLPQGSLQHPAMQIRNIMRQGGDGGEARAGLPPLTKYNDNS